MIFLDYIYASLYLYTNFSINGGKGGIFVGWVELKNNSILLARIYEIQKIWFMCLCLETTWGEGEMGLGFCWVALGLLIMMIPYMVWVFQYILIFDTN